MALICVRTAGSSFINACTFAPCSANPYGADTRLTQNAVLPVSGLANAIMRFPGPIPPILFFSTDKLNCHLLTTFNSSSNSVMLFVTASNFSVGNPVLCFSIRLVIKLKSAGLPLNISVASIAIFCATSLSINIFIMSSAISFDGSCVSFISSSNSLNCSFAALVSAGLNTVVCREYNSSILISASYFSCAFCIVSYKEPKLP